MAAIQGVFAREIIDGHGWPTIEVRLMLDSGFVAIAQAPTWDGSSQFEYKELRDQDPSRYSGMGTLQAVDLVCSLVGRMLQGKDPTRQKEIDQLLMDLDGTGNWSKLGVNTAWAVSSAVCKAGAYASQLPVYRWLGLMGQRGTFTLPTPIFTILSGGKRGTGNTIDFQNFYLIPHALTGYGNILRCGCEIYLHAQTILAEHKALFGTAHEGGYAPNLFSNQDAFLVIRESAKKAGYAIGQQVNLGMCANSATFFNNGAYHIRDRTQPLTPLEMFLFYKEIVDTQQVFYLEDPYVFDDFASWSQLHKELGKDLLVVADAMVGGSSERLALLKEHQGARGVTLTSGQGGTVTNFMNLAKSIREGGSTLIVASRLGETEDAFIADVAVGLGADYCRLGAPARGEHVAKYIRLGEIDLDAGTADQV